MTIQDQLRERIARLTEMLTQLDREAERIKQLERQYRLGETRH
jgi:hypothetical protein